MNKGWFFIFFLNQMIITSDKQEQHVFDLPWRSVDNRMSYNQQDLLGGQYYKIILKNCSADQATYLLAQAHMHENQIATLIDACHDRYVLTASKELVVDSCQFDSFGKNIIATVMYGFMDEQYAQDVAPMSNRYKRLRK